MTMPVERNAAPNLHVGLADQLGHIAAARQENFVQAPGGPVVWCDGAGAMQGHRVAVGDGVARNKSLSAAATFKAMLRSAGRVLVNVVRKIVGGIVRSPFMAPAWLHNHVVQPSMDAGFRTSNASMLKKLEASAPGSVGASDNVVNLLTAHAERQASPLSSNDIRGLVASGEKIAHALLASGRAILPVDDAGSPVKVTIADETLTLHSSMYTTRALSWYMMACAAEQDVATQKASPGSELPGNMVSKGSFVMKDPGNAIYKFLAAAPTCGARISTHFSERSASPEGGLLGKPVQMGIEDYRGMMPGWGGALLFDRLIPGADGQAELFVKLESAGCPPLFQAAAGALSFFSATDRFLQHALNFTGNEGAVGQDVVVRQEHVTKGRLYKAVAKPFKALMREAGKANMLLPGKAASASAILALGFPAVESVVSEIIAAAKDESGIGDPENGSLSRSNMRWLLADAEALRTTIKDEKAALGIVSDAFGIRRRGAEVHLNLQRLPVADIARPA